MPIMDATEWILGPFITPILLGATAVVLLLWYSSKKQQYWKNKGIPYVTPVPIFGSILDTFNKPLHDVERDRYKKFGDIYGHFEGERPLLSVADPTLLKNILVKDFHMFTSRRIIQSGEPILDKMVSILTGEDWKRVRTIITPTFTTGKIKKMISIFKDCANSCESSFKQYAESGKPVDLKLVFGAFTMDIIASAAFSTKIDSHNDPNNKFVTNARKVFTRHVSWRFILFLLFPKIQRFFGISIFSPEAMHFFKDVTLQIIQERRRTGKTRNDFLQLLMDTAKEVENENPQETTEKEDITENYGKDDVSTQIFNIVTKKKLSLDELIAQCVVFFLAGYDTTASTLSFATYLLALNPEIQEKLIAHIDEALRDTNGNVTYEALQNMKYLDNVISETLRLFPPLVRMERLADEDYKLGDTGITVKQDMMVTIPVYALQRDPKYFPEPEKFDPDRFNSEERSKRDQYVYMPFGAGPRNCVGMRFALMELKVCLATIFSKFRAKKCAHTKVPLEFYLGQQLLQPKDLFVQMELRKDN